MSLDIFDEIGEWPDLKVCHDCWCIVIQFFFDEHKENCAAYQKRWKEEYDSQLGASEITPDFVDSPPNEKLLSAWESIVEARELNGYEIVKKKQGRIKMKAASK